MIFTSKILVAILAATACNGRYTVSGGEIFDCFDVVDENDDNGEGNNIGDDAATHCFA